MKETRPSRGSLILPVSVRKTVGEEAVERLENPDLGQGIVDTQKEIDKEYFTEVYKCAQKQKDWDKPFYVVVHIKIEQLMHNVIRRYFFARQTLPTPQWDQTVWRYYPKTGNCEFVWVLPDVKTAQWMASDPMSIPEEQLQLYGFVQDCLDQTLLKKFQVKFDEVPKRIQVAKA